MGLLLPHKRKLAIYQDMVSIYPDIEHEASGGGKRDEIKTFSSESRYRLFRLLHSLSFERVTFVTLTYPREFPRESRIYKSHLKEYRRRFEERYGAVPAVWRLEFQKRGAPHYHLLYLDCPFIPVKEWSSLWADVVHSNGVHHRKNGVDVKLITKGKESALIASYVAKYVGKLDNCPVGKHPQKPGRWWGKWNIQEPEPDIYELTEMEAQSFMAGFLLSRKKSNWVPPDPLTCTVFGEGLGTDKTKVLAENLVHSVKGRFAPSTGRK